MLDKPAAPLYAQVKEAIIDSIAGGQYKPGDQLPSQRELATDYSASHMTVRRAINELIAENVIYAIPGKGLFVVDSKQQAEISPLVGFSEDMSRRGMQASSRVLKAELVMASTTLACTFDIQVGVPLVYLRRLRLADGAPMAVQAAYLRHSLCPGLLEHDLEVNSLYTILREVYGLRLAFGQSSVEAVLADEEHARLLGISQPAALLVTEQLTYLDSGEAVEFARTAYRGDRYWLRFT